MAFEWPRFLEQHRIEYSEGGANVSRDNIVIHCPFCGAADQSMHMSINLSGKGWRCWKNPSLHRGKNAARLVMALLSCTIERANQIVGNAVYIPDDFLARVRNTINPPDVQEPTPLKMPKEFKDFAGLPSARPFENYMRHERGFTWDEIDRMFRYDVRYCTRGAYRGRIIFPIKFKKQLVSWTGRTISKNEELRYRALSTDPERAEREGYKPAIGAISHYLLWFDDLRKADADTIVLGEGPFDSLKVRVLGRREGVTSTCFFTSEPTGAQIDLLHELLPRFKYRYMLLDRGTFATGIRVSSALSSLGVVPLQLHPSLKDPGEFTVSTFRKFLLTLRRRRV